MGDRIRGGGWKSQPPQDGFARAAGPRAVVRPQHGRLGPCLGMSHLGSLAVFFFEI